MRKSKLIAAAFLVTGVLLGQTADTKQPKLKSKTEQEAVMAVFNAPDPAARLAGVDNLLTKFADTEFKATALYIATVSAEETGNFEKVVIYGERTLEADPKNYGVMLSMARGYASRTREFDLDKEEKLGKAEKYAKSALELLKTAPKVNPQIPDDQWEAQRKNFMSEGYEALGLSASVRKKYDEAIANYKLAMDNAPSPNVMVRMAAAYNDSKKPDEAIAVLDKVLAAPDLNPQIKSVAENEKKRSAQIKAAK